MVKFEEEEVEEIEYQPSQNPAALWEALCRVIPVRVLL